MLALAQLLSLDDLRCQAEAWDDLWRRSASNCPTSRAELMAQWVEQFAPRSEFRAVGVKEAGKWLAALPLLGTKVLGTIRVGTAPGNDWSAGGELLVDPNCDVARVLDLLVRGVAELAWPVLRIDEVLMDSTEWKTFAAALRRAGMPASMMERYLVAWLDIDHDWNAYTGRWSRSFRKQNARLMRRLAEVGEVRFETRSSFDPVTLDAWLQTGFEVEHRGWKGRAGTSVLSRGMYPFFHRQARQLAEWSQLQLALLYCDDRPIAFVYGMVGKGVFHSFKIGYDDSCAKFNPGQILDHNLYRAMWDDPAYRAVDFFGVFTADQQHWRPTTRRLGRVVVGTGGMLGRAAVHACQHWWPGIRTARRRLLDVFRQGKGRRLAGTVEAVGPCPSGFPKRRPSGVRESEEDCVTSERS